LTTNNGGARSTYSDMPAPYGFLSATRKIAKRDLPARSEIELPVYREIVKSREAGNIWRYLFDQRRRLFTSRRGGAQDRQEQRREDYPGAPDPLDPAKTTDAHVDWPTSLNHGASADCVLRHRNEL
jgi:hypothetical protein